ncbi:MAG TPA: glycosyltransferase, partial [Bacteroidetes bacterium]|nr:glycosyltransferase [Bacteroidota bacterium]
ATNNGGPLEIIEHEKDGLLFDRTAEDLADKISTLYHNPALKEKLAGNGYLKAKEKFNAEVQLEKLLGVIYEG